eukprot:8497347-Alexandrium_andersonii.AAC.1
MRLRIRGRTRGPDLRSAPWCLRNLPARAQGGSNNWWARWRARRPEHIDAEWTTPPPRATAGLPSRVRPE